MITPYGAITPLARGERLALAGALATCIDDTSPAVGVVLGDWAGALGCQIPMLSSWITDELDSAALDELIRLLRGPVFRARLVRIVVSISRRHDSRPDTGRLGAAVHDVIGAVLQRRTVIGTETARALADARKAA